MRMRIRSGSHSRSWPSVLDFTFRAVLFVFLLFTAFDMRLPLEYRYGVVSAATCVLSYDQAHVQFLSSGGYHVDRLSTNDAAAPKDERQRAKGDDVFASAHRTCRVDFVYRLVGKWVFHMWCRVEVSHSLSRSPEVLTNCLCYLRVCMLGIRIQCVYVK